MNPIRIINSGQAIKPFKVILPDEKDGQPFWIKSEAVRYARREAKRLKCEIVDQTK